MKMTDAEMDAMVEQIIDRAGRESSMDGMDGDRWDRILVRAALTARLAADQQKGGGEDLPWGYYTLRDGREEFYNLRNSTNFRRLTDMLQRGVKTLRDAFPDDAVLLYTTPQTSIPAPAQPGVDEAMARRYLAAQKAHVSKVDAAFGRQVAGALHSDDVVAACMAGLAAAFNVPAKQDGKASGGECAHRWVQDDEHPNWACCQLCNISRRKHADQETQG